MRAAPVIALLSLAMAGCSSIDRLAGVGSPPPLTAIDNPAAVTGYAPVRMPMPIPVVDDHSANSLWRTGSRTFFRDQRAQRVGDILTVTVKITDKADIQNTTKRSRTENESLNAGGGLDSKFIKLLPGVTDATAAVDVTSGGAAQGAGSVARSEQLTTSVAAVVTQVLPNGNLVIEGRQEVRVNFELRELIVAGVVRPEDIGAENIVDSSKIAEARISYGGRGQISDVQQPRVGAQVLDVLLPF
ncbi:MAG: flagellar basal body L-ring protein FlgH [Bauldia sp.]